MTQPQASGDAVVYTLGLLAEEAGEVLQLVGKSLRFGINTPGRLGPDGQVTGETPRSLLPTELGDMLAAVEFACRHAIFDRNEIETARDRKLAKLCNPASLDNLGRRLAPQPPALSPATPRQPDAGEIAGLRGAAEAYLAAKDGGPDLDCWDTESGEAEPGAVKFSSDWAWTEYHGEVEAALTKLRAALARQEPAQTWRPPLDDPSRELADSALPDEMIQAGVDALEKAQADSADPNSENDWDVGMVVVAVYRAMTAKSLPTPSETP